MRKNIILIGYMGCGKTTVGKSLAKLESAIFLDTDERIEEKQGRSISEIFASDSEKAFRDMETAYLKDLIRLRREGMIVSTGGGMPVRMENRELLRELGFVVYLKAEPETVYERVKDDIKRPLLQCEDPLAKIRDMMGQRREAYESTAHYILQVDQYKQQELAEMIQKRYGDLYEIISY